MADAKENDEITEEEFDALLDAIDARKSAEVEGHQEQAISVPAETGGAAPVAGGSDLITEEEFDAVLDRLAAEKQAAVMEGKSTESDGVVGEYLSDLCDDADAAAVIIDLKGKASIAQAADLHSRLVELMDAPGPFHLDADIDAVDTAGIQLLLAFVEDAKRKSRVVVWSNPSPVLIENVRRLGLADQLLLSEHLDKAA